MTRSPEDRFHGMNKAATLLAPAVLAGTLLGSTVPAHAAPAAPQPSPSASTAPLANPWGGCPPGQWGIVIGCRTS